MSPLPALALLLFASAVQAADLKVLSGNGARAAVLELAARFDRATGHKTTVEFAVNPETRKKIESGQPFDVAVMNPPQLDALIKQNLIAAEVVASGEADMVVVVASRISGVKGVQLIGGIPQELQTWIGFAAGASAKTKEPQAARAMLRFFTAPEARPVLRGAGVEPFAE